MYRLQTVTDPSHRNDYITATFKPWNKDQDVSLYSFLSSREWGDFNDRMGNKPLRFAIMEEKKQVGVLLLIIYKAKRGSYFLSPHGILTEWNYYEVLEAIKPAVKDLAKQYRIDFWRINGVTPQTIAAEKSYQDLGFISAPMHAHAEETHILDLTLGHETLLANMRKNTRYMVKRAQTEGVEVIHTHDRAWLEKFTEMHHHHAFRANGKPNYVPFSPQYLSTLYDTFGDKMDIFVGSYQGVVEAITITLRFGKTTVYYLGASDIKNPKFSPAYLTQWTAIEYAQSQGSESYNFRWVSPDENPKHPLAGVSLFKRGFGGEDHFLTHAHDLIFTPKYALTRLVESRRRRKRGYYFHKPRA